MPAKSRADQQLQSTDMSHGTLARRASPPRTATDNDAKEERLPLMLHEACANLYQKTESIDPFTNVDAEG
jgi:hypothetical protein